MATLFVVILICVCVVVVLRVAAHMTVVIDDDVGYILNGCGYGDGNNAFP